MSEVTVEKLINPKDGQRVELPSEIGRIDVDRFGPLHRAQADGNLGVAVVGTGEPVEYVVLTEKGTGDVFDLPDGSQVLAFDNARDVLVYAVPVANYGGGA